MIVGTVAVPANGTVAIVPTGVPITARASKVAIAATVTRKKFAAAVAA